VEAGAELNNEQAVYAFMVWELSNHRQLSVEMRKGEMSVRSQHTDAPPLMVP